MAEALIGAGESRLLLFLPLRRRDSLHARWPLVLHMMRAFIVLALGKVM